MVFCLHVPLVGVDSGVDSGEDTGEDSGEDSGEVVTWTLAEGIEMLDLASFVIRVEVLGLLGFPIVGFTGPFFPLIPK